MAVVQEHTKQTLIDIFKAKYLRNEELTELAIAKSDLNYLLAILNEYNSFANFEKEIGYLQRHSREREKYSLFLTFVRRFAKDGFEAMRPKNIENELQQEAIRLFGSLSALTKKTILCESQDTVIYYAHTYFLRGGNIDDLESERPQLYSKILEHYNNIATFSLDYQKKFFLNPLEDFRKGN